MKEVKHDFSQNKAISIKDITSAIAKKHIKLENKLIKSIVTAISLTVLINTFLIGDVVAWTDIFSKADVGEEQIVSVFKLIANLLFSAMTAVAIIIMLVIIYTAVYASIENKEEDLEGNEIRKNDVDLYYRLAPARVILSEINLKSMLRSPSKPILYKAMETGEYLIQPRIFIKKPALRFVVVSLGMTIMGLLSHIIIFKSVTISDSIEFSVIIMVSLIAVELTHSLIRLISARTKLKQIINADPIGACGELNLRITNRPFWDDECLSGENSQSDLTQFKVLGMSDFSDLIQIVGINSYIGKLIIRVEWLNVEALSILMGSNKNSSLKMNQYREIYLINNKKLQCVIEDFVPTCMNELRRLIKKNNHTAHLAASSKEASKRFSDLNETNMTVFMKIEAEVKRQVDLIKLIESQYQDISENTTSNGFMSIIDNQKKGWLSYDEMGFSPKVQILETKLNQSTVPEIEALMINANDEQKIVLKEKLLEIKSLVDEIASKEKQQLQ